MPFILRRSRLGATSCRAIQQITGFHVTREPSDIPAGELVFRWGCTASIPESVNVVNKAEAIHRVNDKLGFRKKLDGTGLCPTSYFGDEDPEEEISAWGFDGRPPIVVRPSVHHQGRHLYLCKTEAELHAAITDIENKLGLPWYASEFIDKVAEYRVFIIQGRTVCVASKAPADPSKVAWNVAQGGAFHNVRWDDWPLRVVRVGTEAFNLSGLDFGGVDVMVDRDGRAYVLEINSAPSLTSPYRQECFARAFSWIATNGKNHIPLISNKGGYKKFIHPAVCDQAILVQGH